MERTATHYRVRAYGVTLPSSYYADCQFFGKGIVLAIASRVWLWDSILVIQPSNDSCAGRCSLWNLHSLKRLAFHGWYARVWLSLAWSNVREDMCYCREDWIADSRRQARNHEQWAGACSISCYVMPIRIVLLVMDTFGAGCCSRIQANVAFLTLSILLLV